MKTKKLVKDFIFGSIIFLMVGILPTELLAWKFIAYGDSRTYPEDHQAALGLVLEHAPDFDFIVNVGDLVGRGKKPEHWDIWENDVTTVFGSTMQSGTPFYISCPGNHEWTEGCTAEELTNWHHYLSYQANRWPENDTRYWYFDHNNARIIILDFWADLTAQKAMIQEACATNTQTWIFAVFHGPVLTFGNKDYDPDLHRKFAQPLYEGGCDMFFVGHAHSYIRSKKVAFDGTNHPLEDEVNGTVQIMTGDGGAGRDPIKEINASGFEYLSTPNYTTMNNQTPGVTIIDIDGANLNLKHYNQDGLLDEANFIPNEKANCSECIVYHSLVASTNGMGTVDPAFSSYEENTIATVTATPAAGWQFDNWSGDISSNNNPINITMDASKNIVANFSVAGGGTMETFIATDDAYIMDNSTSANTGSNTIFSVKNKTRKVGLVKFDVSSVSENIVAANLILTGTNDGGGSNLSVYSINNDNWSQSSVTYNNKPDQGDFLVATTIGAALSEYRIDISEFVIEQQGVDGIVSLWINDDQNTVNRMDFASIEHASGDGPKLEVISNGGEPPVMYDLTVGAVNGTVTPSSGPQPEGAVVSLTAIPNSGYQFSNWSGDLSGTQNPKSVTMDSDKNVVANFTEIQTVSYTLITTVSGSGTVSPASGQVYPEGTVVPLTATPDAGWTFENWSGDISGTNSSTSITMNSDKQVTATFVENIIPDVTDVLIPVEDAWTNQTKGNTNYGVRTELKAKKDNKEAYLKFDLNAIGTVSSAILELTSDVAGTIELWNTSDSWTEGSLTWNNAPNVQSLIGTYSLSGGLSSINLTTYIEEQASTDNVASIVIRELNLDIIFIDSKEGANVPTLTIEHDDVPKKAIDANAIGVKVYPNPTTGNVYINISDADFTSGEVRIYNSQGQLLETISINNSDSVFEIANEAGLYLIEVIYNDQIQVIPVMKK